MNWKQHKLLSISAILFVILMLAGGGLLFKTRSGYMDQKQQLKGKLGELDKLNKRNPFPNRDNLKVLEDSLERVQTFYTTMLDTMAEGQVEPKEIEPARFPAMLNGSLHRLRQSAKKEKILLPKEFSFGFQTYADGSLPKSDHVARLTSQVQMVESLVETIISAGAESIRSVERELFEAEVLKTEVRPVSRRRSSSAAKKKPEPVKESEQYRSESITVSFSGTDQAVWAALNALASHDQFVVVTELELENPVKPNVEAAPVFRKTDGGVTGRKSSMPMTEMDLFLPPGVTGEFPAGVRGGFPAGVGGGFPTGGRGAPEDPDEFLEEEVGPPVSHEERIVAGRESVLATITVKIFQFNPEELAGEEETAQEGSSS